MKNLKDIIEGLKINSKTKINNNDISPGEKMIRVIISDDRKEIKLDIEYYSSRGKEYPYYIFKEIKGGQMYFKLPYDDWGSDITTKNKDHYKEEIYCFPNKNGYYQAKNFITKRGIIRDKQIILYLNTKDSIKFIKDVLIKKDINKLENYFDLDIFSEGIKKSFKFKSLYDLKFKDLEMECINKLLKELEE